MAADGKTPPTHPQGGGGAGTLCVHVVSLCADTKTMTCRPWCRHKNNDMSTLLGHAHTYIPTDRQTDRHTGTHTYINQYKHIVIPIHGCICVTYPPFGGGGGGTRGGWIIYMKMHLHNITSNFFTTYTFNGAFASFRKRTLLQTLSQIFRGLHLSFRGAI